MQDPTIVQTNGRQPPPIAAEREPQPTPENDDQGSPAVEKFIARTVTTVMAMIALLAFAFSFGNVWHLAQLLGVPAWIAPLVGPAVDLSVVGLLLGIQYVALRHPSPTGLRPARALLIFSGLATLGLNVAEPLAQAEYGRAAIDAVAPLLLIGWSEVGPGLLRQIYTARSDSEVRESDSPMRPTPLRESDSPMRSVRRPPPTRSSREHNTASGHGQQSDSALLEQARRIDARHRAEHGRSISADNLRRELSISTAKARALASTLRTLVEADDHFNGR